MEALFFYESKLAGGVGPGAQVIAGDNDGDGFFPERGATGVQVAEEFEPPASLPWVNAEQRIIDEQDLGVERQSPGEADALMQVTGDLGGTFIGDLGQTDGLKNFFDGLES